MQAGPYGACRSGTALFRIRPDAARTVRHRVEFRSPLIDRLVLYLINLGVVKPSDFEEKERGVRMNDRARKAYLQNYEKFMTTSFVNYGTRESTKFRQILRGNVVQLEKCLLKNEIFNSFVFYA